MNNEEKKAKRRQFAEMKAASIRNALRQIEWQMWEKAAEEAKEKGLYAPTTYIGDVCTGLKSHAGIRYGSFVKEYP